MRNNEYGHNAVALAPYYMRICKRFATILLDKDGWLIKEEASVMTVASNVKVFDKPGILLKHIRRGDLIRPHTYFRTKKDDILNVLNWKRYCYNKLFKWV